jgi:predicted phage baseplate assembly protein
VGAQSTLRLYVNNVEWHEVPSLAGLTPTDRKFVTATDDSGVTTLTFGNGVEGSRLPTGVQNISSTYRNGIGAPGNVEAGQITLLQTRPLGVKAVLNPLRASGGADRENRDLARENTPLSVMPLDRLVSVQDYADFARNFAGIAKAVAQRLSDGRRELVYLTIAGVDDIPIDPSSDLYRNLLQALRDLGDPDLPVRIDLREQVALVLSAAIKLLPDYQWETVAAAVRCCLLERFGFAKRALGQPALRCELLSAIQNVPGVAYVDINAFGGVPERSAGDDGSRVLATQQDISRQIQYIVHPESQDQVLIARYVHTPQGLRLVVPPPPGPSEFVYASAGGVENGGLAPAQLAVFAPAVPDTLILNQIP